MMVMPTLAEGTARRTPVVRRPIGRHPTGDPGRGTRHTFGPALVSSGDTGAARETSSLTLSTRPSSSRAHPTVEAPTRPASVGTHAGAHPSSKHRFR